MSMASVSVIAFLAIFFVLQPLTAPSNFLSPLSPLLAPAFGLFLAELCLKICRMHDFFFLVLVVIILDSLMGLRVYVILSTGSILNLIFILVWSWMMMMIVFLLLFFILWVQRMSVIRWPVERESARLLKIALSFMNVNAILAGSRILWLLIKISSFSLALPPTVSSFSIFNFELVLYFQLTFFL